MNAPTIRASFFRVSLRELLLFFGFLAMGCAALKYANNVWWFTLSTIGLLVLLAAAVVAVVDRGRAQATAIGFVVCVAIYGVLFWLAPTSTPPRAMLQRLWEENITEATITEVISGNGGRTLVLYDAQGLPVQDVSTVQSPNRERFMAVGHLLWALLLGYLGGRFAGWVYDRRTRREVSGGAMA